MRCSLSLSLLDIIVIIVLIVNPARCGSIFTRSAAASANYSGPLGRLSYATAEKDETVVPGKGANYYGLKAAINGSTEILDPVTNQ